MHLQRWGSISCRQIFRPIGFKTYDWSIKLFVNPYLLMRRFKTSPDESYERLQSVNLKRITLNNSLITGVDFAVPERSALVKKNNQLFLEKTPVELTFN